MKKQLLSTSALVAAGLVALSTGAEAQTAPGSSPITMSLGGFMRQHFGYVDQDDVLGLSSPATVTGKPAHVVQWSDTEIYFLGKTTLSNGIAIGVRVELEGNTSTDMIDESFMQIEGTFGTIHLGSTDNAAQKMVYTAPSAWTGGSYANGAGTPAAAGIAGMSPTNTGTGLTGTLAMGEDDSNLISYFTPRIEGFQLGYSYIPQIQQDNNVALNAGASYGRGNSLGLNFVRNIAGVDVNLSAGYMQWKKPDNTAVFNTATLQDPKAWTVGGQLGYAGFKVGGGYGKVEDYMQITAAAAGATAAVGTTATNSGDGDAYEYGITYTFGPTTVGITGNSGRMQSTTTNPGMDHQETWRLEGSYVLGPGVSFTASLYQSEAKGERAANVQGTASGVDTDNNKVTGLVAAVALSF